MGLDSKCRACYSLCAFAEAVCWACLFLSLKAQPLMKASPVHPIKASYPVPCATKFPCVPSFLSLAHSSMCHLSYLCLLLTLLKVELLKIRDCDIFIHMRTGMIICFFFFPFHFGFCPFLFLKRILEQ